MPLPGRARVLALILMPPANSGITDSSCIKIIYSAPQAESLKLRQFRRIPQPFTFDQEGAAILSMILSPLSLSHRSSSA
jgi:hypothetical protein